MFHSLGLTWTSSTYFLRGADFDTEVLDSLELIDVFDPLEHADSLPFADSLEPVDALESRDESREFLPNELRGESCDRLTGRLLDRTAVSRGSAQPLQLPIGYQ